MARSPPKRKAKNPASSERRKRITKLHKPSASSVRPNPDADHDPDAEAPAEATAKVAAPTDDYDDNLDSIVRWNINRKDSTVTLTTRRSTDDSRRQVPEDVIQRANERKLLDYWGSFRRPRQVTIKCGSYRVFKILDHQPGKTPKLLIQWVGYPAEPGATSWEPLDAIMASAEALVLDYLDAHNLTRQLTPRKWAPPGSTHAKSGTRAAGAKAPASSKKRRADSSAPAAKRLQKETAWSDAAGGTELDEQRQQQQQPAGDQEAEPTPTPAVGGRRRGRPRGTMADAAATKASLVSTGPAMAVGAGPPGLVQLDLRISGFLPHENVQKLVDLINQLRK